MLLIKLIGINLPIFFLITVICNNEGCAPPPQYHYTFYLITALSFIYRYAWLLSIAFWLQSIVGHWQLKKHERTQIPSSIVNGGAGQQVPLLNERNSGTSFEQSLRDGINILLRAKVHFLQPSPHTVVFRDALWPLAYLHRGHNKPFLESRSCCMTHAWRRFSKLLF